MPDSTRPVRCVHCGLDIEDRGRMSMDLNHQVSSWIHDPGRYEICYPQQKNSPRAEPDEEA